MVAVREKKIPLLIIQHRRPGPRNPAYGIPSSEWPTVLKRVLEHKGYIIQQDFEAQMERIRAELFALPVSVVQDVHKMKVEGSSFSEENEQTVQN